MWGTVTWHARALGGYLTAVASVGFSPDGKRLATGTAQEALRLWDSDSWQDVFTWMSGVDLILISHEAMLER